jgi:hypothetical protein
MVGRCGLARLHHLRGERPEYRFLYRDRRPRLPVIRDGHLFFARWGNGRRQSRCLPRSGWTWLATINQGLWQDADAIPVEIPASYALDGRGVWFKVHVGIRGLLVPDERGSAVAYMVCEPASPYYRVMTGSDRMPIFINQTI